MRPLNVIAAVLASTVIAAHAQAEACCQSGGFHGAAACVTINKPVTVYKPTTVNNSVTISKPVTVNKTLNVYKPVTVYKNVEINKPVTIDKSISITKNVDSSKTIDASKTIDIEKNVSVNKSVVINKGGDASSGAFAEAVAQAGATVSNNVVVYSGGYYESAAAERPATDVSGIQATQQCRAQEATVVKAIHAVCVSPDGREFPASHMTADTWIDASRESEILRCIPGAHLRITVGDVLETDQGMAGTFAAGRTIDCSEHEALRHYKDGMLKCAVKQPVPDCTERTNLRKFGTGDLFFSYRTTVCAPGRALELTGMPLNGGVGDGGY